MRDIVEQLRSLDINDVGRWPTPFRVALIVLVFAGVVGGGFWYKIVREEMPRLERAEREEQQLRGTFENRQVRAANLDAYREQLGEMEQSFGAMLRQLPSRTEVPSLLIDISQTGLAAGLEERLFQPGSETPRDFYAELPIRIRLVGGYHQLARFVSEVAALPRIVTLHDFQIQPETQGSNERLVLDVTARTYRYLDDLGDPR